MKKIPKIFLIFLFVFLVFLIFNFLVYKNREQKEITWGVNFSQMQAKNLQLDWKKTYLAILEDLGVKNIKLHTQWDFVESEKDNFYFNDIDWQINEAEKHNAKLIYVVGMKTGRWPECHIPTWANDIPKKEQQEEILDYIREIVLKYKDRKSIIYWQVENEPLFNFGICPWYDEKFLKKEVNLVKSLDPTRAVIITDSGEQSLWLRAARIGDVIGVTMYRKVWVHITETLGFYMNLPFPSISYWVKANIVKKLFNKEVINIELQAEPWGRKFLLRDVPIKEQEKTMNLNQFKKNINFAKQTGSSKFYFWGVEWWYWMKEKQNSPEIWEEARKLF